MISDVHTSGNPSEDTEQFLIAGLCDMKKAIPDSIALVNTGDFTKRSSKEQYESFFQILGQYGPEPSKVVNALGNHDVRGGDVSTWNKDETKEGAYWSTAKELYLTNNRPYMPDTNGRTYFDKWLGGYHFIVLNTERAIKDAMYLSEEQLQWLEKTLAEDAAEEKPIFVLGHNGLNDTHWRSNILNGFGLTDGKVKEIFSKYPQVIYLSGHIHNGFGVAEVIDREFGCMVEIPSFNESENGDTSHGTGWVAEVSSDKIQLKARNFKDSKWLPEYDVEIPLPSLPVVYQKAKKLYAQGMSCPNLPALLEEACALLHRQYDQSVIEAWDDVRPPAKSLYNQEVRKRICIVAKELKRCIDSQ
ncbi:MAG: metallophosphoesterase [bacterium]|nr:metallophosphoesterase [bacterium]